MRLLKEIDNKLSDIVVSNSEVDKIEEKMWIHLTNPTIDEVSLISDKTNLDKTRLIESLDPEETAHIDFDGDDLLTVDIPVLKNGFYETVPFVIMSNDNYLVTMCSEEVDIIDKLKLKIKKLEPHKHIRLTLQLLYGIVTKYIQALRLIDKRRIELESRINTSTKNKEIFELMDLNKALVYLSTSLNSNKNVLIRLERMPEYKKYEADYDLMDDVIIENNQAIEMCSIHRQILDGMLNAFASITSNNLNIIMKLLTIITLVIAVPTLIGSFYGMNVIDIPLAKVSGAFWVIVSISAVLAVIGAILLIKVCDIAVKPRKRKKINNFVA